MQEVRVQSLVGSWDPTYLAGKEPRHKPEAGLYKSNKDFKNKVHIGNHKKNYLRVFTSVHSGQSAEWR